MKYASLFFFPFLLTCATHDILDSPEKSQLTFQLPDEFLFDLGLNIFDIQEIEDKYERDNNTKLDDYDVQDIFDQLLNDSIKEVEDARVKENIAVAEPDISQEEVNRIAQQLASQIDIFQVPESKRVDESKKKAPEIGSDKLPISFYDNQQIEGKHFILTEQGLYKPGIKQTKGGDEQVEPSDIKAYFSPDDNVQKIVEELIDKEEESLRIAIFSFTDPRIAKAIQRACKRGVQVEIVTDHSCLRDRLSSVGELADCGCSIYAYSPSLTSKSSCMHNKFILAKKNCGCSCLLTGSYNFTRSAAQANQENVLMIKDHGIFKRYEEQFEILKKRSYRYGRPKTVFINARRGFITTIPS